VARHALPLAAPPLAVCAAATVAATVLGEAALTFLGFGVPAGAPSWGELLRQAHQNALAWWLAVPAGAAVTLVSLAAHTLADELSRSS
jgi:ABC-type dipeptide/oligopeptide/nickel transport system permease subunit